MKSLMWRSFRIRRIDFGDSAARDRMTKLDAGLLVRHFVAQRKSIDQVGENINTEFYIS
jgi:hypothetical protein